MATKQQILGILRDAGTPMSVAQLEEKIGQKQRLFQTQVKRWTALGLINERDSKFQLTHKGQAELRHLDDIEDLDDDEPVFNRRERPGGIKQINTLWDHERISTKLVFSDEDIGRREKARIWVEFMRKVRDYQGAVGDVVGLSITCEGNLTEAQIDGYASEWVALTSRVRRLKADLQLLKLESCSDDELFIGRSQSR